MPRKAQLEKEDRNVRIVLSFTIGRVWPIVIFMEVTCHKMDRIFHTLYTIFSKDLTIPLSLINVRYSLCMMTLLLLQSRLQVAK